MTQDHGGDRGGHRRTPRPLRSAASADASPPGGGRPALPRGHGRRCRPDRHPGRRHARRRQVGSPRHRRRPRLIAGAASPVERVCWVVPRDTLRRQAEEAFVDPAWRAFLGHAHSVRAAENAPDPCRGLSGYVTTYQAVAAAPELHLAEFRQHRYLLCIDELHHLPALSDLDHAASAAEDTAWSRALLPLLETAGLRLLMSGTLERADKRPILWLGYRRDRWSRHRRGRPQGARLGGGRLRPARRPGRARDRAGPLRRARRRGRVARGRRAAGCGLVPRRGRAGCGRCCSPRCAPATPTGCCGAPSSTAASAGRRAARRSASVPATRPGASASCWSWRPTRRPRGATPPRCAAGSAVRRRAWRSRSRTSGTRSSASPASGCCPSRRCWSRSGWPTRAWTRRRSRTSPA